MGKIAWYYTDLGRENISGDSTASYAQFWEDLTAIADGNIAEIDNSTTALMIYKETANQIYINVNKFKKEGITKKEMQDQLDSIAKHIQTDITITDDSNSDRINGLIEEVNINIGYAQKALDTAF